MNPFSLDRSLTPDDAMGMVWRNILKHEQLAYWLTKMGHACSMADAWAVFKRSRDHPNNCSP